MGIFIDKNTTLIVQGITGTMGSFHTRQMIEYGTRVTAGVTPGKGNSHTEGIPVFNTVAQAKNATHANASIIFVPPAYAADSIMEAVDAGIELVVCITEGIPVLDMLQVKKFMENKKTRLIGPNCPGLITPNESKVGILPGYIHKKGHIGVVSRSGTLTYEAVNQLTHNHLGQSTAVGIGGDPVIGTDFIAVLDAFNKDPETYGVVLIGEIGSSSEEDAALWISRNMNKPVSAFISGQSAPTGRRMGHAGAIISGSSGSAAKKIEEFTRYGIPVADTADKICQTLISTLKAAGIYEKCLSSGIG